MKSAALQAVGAVRHQLDILRAPLPVVLDPVLRLSRSGSTARESWRLPQHAQSQVLLTFGGTAALYQAARAIGGGQAAKILVPAYNCGHEIEPLLRAGAQVGFYRVDEQLGIDLEHIASMIDGATKAVLVTHYFGFPQPVRAIRELCDRHGLALIEDCAHALFSCDGDEPLGSAGHFAVFSLRKTLPLPHGGALVCHDPRWSIPRRLATPPALSTVPKLLERYQKAWLLPRHGQPGLMHRAAFVTVRLMVDISRGVRALGRALGQIQLDPDDESFDLPTETLDWGMSEGVAGTVFCADAPAIVTARRRNYELLLSRADRFQGCRPVLPVLPAGACPLYFPVFSDDPDEQLNRLLGSAVAAVPWWGSEHPVVPWQQFAEAVRLKRQLIALPVHQDLTVAHMDRIAALLAEA